MASLVIRDGLFLEIRKRHGIATLAHEDSVACFFEVTPMNFGGTFAYRKERCLIHKVGEIGAAHPGCAPSNEIEIDVGVDALVADMYIANLSAIFEFRQGDNNLTVESAWTK
ncbi:unannotated protein [freshwater metagenome]|uniref:Unannotated protein n=1 Tax=freshwater metagenome TaxID=449393 RepID=A0A6J6YI35_9ZZZZ